MLQSKGNEIPETEMNLSGDRAVTCYGKEHSKINSSQSAVLRAQGITVLRGSSSQVLILEQPRDFEKPETPPAW